MKIFEDKMKTLTVSSDYVLECIQHTISDTIDLHITNIKLFPLIIGYSEIPNINIFRII